MSFSLYAGNGKHCISVVNKAEIYFSKLGWRGTKWAIIPLVSLTLGPHSRVSFSLYAGNGKHCISFVNKVEIYFSKMGWRGSKWINLIAKTYHADIEMILTLHLAGTS